jgi:hypothetical protein
MITKDRFYEEHLFYKLPKYHMKILLGDLNAKVGREDIFKPIVILTTTWWWQKLGKDWQ